MMVPGGTVVQQLTEFVPGLCCNAAQKKKTKEAGRPGSGMPGVPGGPLVGRFRLLLVPISACVRLCTALPCVSLPCLLVGEEGGEATFGAGLSYPES